MYCDICSNKTKTNKKIEYVTLNFYNICNSKKCKKIVEQEFKNNKEV